jgi:hypothetical protein
MSSTGNLTFRHLRLTEAACFKRYLENTHSWGEISNEAYVNATGSDKIASAETIDTVTVPLAALPRLTTHMMDYQ